MLLRKFNISELHKKKKVILPRMAQMEPKCPRICKTWNRHPSQHFCFKQSMKCMNMRWHCQNQLTFLSYQQPLFLKRGFKTANSYSEDFLQLAASKVNHTLSNPSKATVSCNSSQNQGFESRGFPASLTGNWTTLGCTGNDFKTWQIFGQKIPHAVSSSGCWQQPLFWHRRLHFGGAYLQTEHNCLPGWSLKTSGQMCH